MRKTLMLGAAVAALFTAGTANAAKVFNVSGTFSSTVSGPANRGSLSGTFTTTDDLLTLLSYNLTSTASGSFSAVTYTGSNSLAVFMPGASTLANQSFLKLSLTSTEALLLNFDGALTNSGVSLIPGALTGSLETQTRSFSTNTRYLSGAVTAVPEPAAWGMMLLGFAMVAGAARYRRRSTVVTYA